MLTQCNQGSIVETLIKHFHTSAPLSSDCKHQKQTVKTQAIQVEILIIH